MRAEIIAIGSELVSGQNLDTNSQWLSRELESLGLPVAFHTTIGDHLGDHLTAFRNAVGRANLVVMTGGLGPTQDDLTREAMALLTNAPLHEDAASLEAIKAMFARRNRPMAERNRVQALVPEGAEPLPNPVGTAPGIWMDLGSSSIACMPGIPSEMRVMFREQVVPRLRLRNMLGRVLVHRKINLFGRGESDIETDAMDLTARGRVPEVGITAHDSTISFRITAAGADEDEAWSETEPTAEIIRRRFGPLVVGEGTTDLAEAVARELGRTGASLAVAESCTGGMIAQMITDIPGVSRNFLGGIVCYSNEAKSGLLDVPASLIEAHGAVSHEVVEAMAEGTMRRFGAAYALATTGIAGPEGGSVEKPVGLVYVCLASAGGRGVLRLELGPEQPRDIIRRRASKHALNMLRLALLDQPSRPAN